MRCYKLKIENNKGCSIYHGMLYCKDRDRLVKANKKLFEMGIIDARWDEIEMIEIGDIPGDEAVRKVRSIGRWFGLYGPMTDKYIASGRSPADAVNEMVREMEEKSRVIVDKLSDGRVVL